MKLTALMFREANERTIDARWEAWCREFGERFLWGPNALERVLRRRKDLLGDGSSSLVARSHRSEAESGRRMR